MRIDLVIGCLVLGLVSCKSSDDTGDTGGREFFVVENEGTACLSDDGTDDLSTGMVEVMLNGCLSGCASDLSAECEAVVVGDTIEVTASGEYSAPTGIAACPAVCVALFTECEVFDLSEDVTTLDYAGLSVDVDYPAEELSCTADM